MSNLSQPPVNTLAAPPDPDDPLLKRPSSVNPYRVCKGEILRRLCWDLRPESWASRSKLKALRDSRRGEKAVILCNGPSLNRVDFDLLRGTYCFGLNKIHLMFSRTDFRPSCIVSVNPLVIEQTANFFNATDIPLFLDSRALCVVKPNERRVYLPFTTLSRTFARDCGMSIYQGNTVTYVALQLAFHMGFHSVAIVGCDHYFRRSGAANKSVDADASDPDHFDPSYFANVRWQLPDLFESEIAYRMADNVFRASGRWLVNATDGGKLEILPRMPLREFLAA